MKLPVSMTIREMRELLPRFTAATDAASVALDGSTVEQIDTAGLQLLIAYQNALIDSGCVVSWAGCSSQLRSAATSLGMQKALGLPKA